MRIIAGEYGGRVFKSPEFKPTRPTTNIAKEGLFNSLNNYFDFNKLSFLDLFGGTGQLSFEIASRGCTDITIVEKFPKCIKFIQGVKQKLAIQSMKVLKQDVFKYIEACNCSYDLIFAGPPYGLETLNHIPDLIFQYRLLNSGGWFILEHNPNHNFREHNHFFKQKNYGQTIFTTFTNK